MLLGSEVRFILFIFFYIKLIMLISSQVCYFYIIQGNIVLFFSIFMLSLRALTILPQ